LKPSQRLSWATASWLALTWLWPQVGLAQEAEDKPWEPRFLGMQATAIWEHLDPFNSPYSGAKSLPGSGDSEMTDTYGIYFGSQLSGHLQVYLDVEMARGTTVGRGNGLGDLTDGDVVRVGSVDLGEDPYVARGYLKWAWGLSPADDLRPRGQGRMPGSVSAERVEVKAGKLAVTDDFDLNRYANSTRFQFLNWGLINNTSWDYASDTRGYTNGVYGAWITPAWELRWGEYQMVTFSNGNIFDNDLSRAHGDNLELTWRAGPDSTAVRLLAYQNFGRMGDYAQAIAIGRQTGRMPDVIADEQPGRRKYGYGLNVEQPLAANGETGLFMRLGWSDGATETFMFAEVDQLFSFGLQVCGCHWGRDADRMGIGFAAAGLSDLHKHYLEAGGIGFIVGDGALQYGVEQVSEIYYRAQLGPNVQIGPDYQYLVNPGYNQDRGPAQVMGLRLRVYDL
jgi:high affinity Mn2+ porin